MTAYAGSPLVRAEWVTTTQTEAAVANGVDSTGYDVGVFGSGTLTRGLPSFITRAYSGSPPVSFVTDWYDHVYHAPLSHDAGALRSPEQVQVSVWNGYETAITIDSVTFTDAAGVTTDVTPGESIAGLRSRVITVTISPTGDRSTLDGYLTFNFSGGYSFNFPVQASEYGVWLSYDAARRCLLVEAQRYGGHTHYLSNLGYISRPADTPANQGYDELVRDDLEVLSKIDGDFVVGQVEVDNTPGDYDAWLGYAWDGWPITIYLGDFSWPRDAFQVLATGTIASLDAPSPDVLAFRIRDKRTRLDVPVLTSRLGNGTPIPVCLGTCFNVEPVYVSGTTYQVHAGAVSAISSVRDRGVAVSKTDNLAAGQFTKTTSPVDRGGITASVVGATDGTVADIIRWLVLRAGLTTADLDEANLLSFPNTATLGLYVRTERTVLDCINEVMASVGGGWRFSREGKVQIFRLDTPAVTADIELDADDIEEDGLTVDGIEPPKASVTLGYARNWRFQDPGAMAGSVSDSDRDLYAKEYSIVRSTSGTIKTTYPLAEDPDLVGTLFADQAAAQAEADRRLALRNVKRTVYRARAFALPFSIQLGQTVKLTYPRFAFTGGANAVVVGLREQPVLDRVEMELWL